MNRAPLPIYPLTLGFGCAAVATIWLPDAQQAGARILVGAVFVGISVWGVVSMRSGIFGRVLTRGKGDRPHVALTYDDGPGDATGPLLDLLRERGVPAAFFVVGARARERPDVVRRCHADGHLVGNHSDRHSNLTNLFPRRRLRSDLEACQETVASLIGERPRFYRPPVGLMNHLVGPVSRGLDLEPVGWQVRSLDTLPRSPSTIATRVLRRTRPGDIILLHDGGLPAARVREITARILDGLQARGLVPVRLDRLLSSV